MKLLEDHNCVLITENKEIAIEKYENNGIERWYLRMGRQMSEIRYCPYCSKQLREYDETWQSGMRLVSEDQVKKIICKYENRNIQKTMVYEVGVLNGCLATSEQLMQIKGNEEIKLE